MSKKTSAIITEWHGIQYVPSHTHDKERDQQLNPTEISLRTIFQKLGSLDHIEWKLDNLNGRAEFAVNIMSKIEEDYEKFKPTCHSSTFVTLQWSYKTI